MVYNICLYHEFPSDDFEYGIGVEYVNIATFFREQPSSAVLDAIWREQKENILKFRDKKYMEREEKRELYFKFEDEFDYYSLSAFPELSSDENRNLGFDEEIPF